MGTDLLLRVMRETSFGPIGTCTMVLEGFRRADIPQLATLTPKMFERSTHLLDASDTSEHDFTPFTNMKNKGSFHDRMTLLPAEMRKDIAILSR